MKKLNEGHNIKGYSIWDPEGGGGMEENADHPPYKYLLIGGSRLQKFEDKIPPIL